MSKKGEYLKSNQVDNYIILDDEIFRDYDEELLPNLVKTTFINGLTEKEQDVAIKKLKK